jgi:hypothetical protein
MTSGCDSTYMYIQECSSDSIEHLAKLAAAEVLAEIEALRTQVVSVEHLSFVGHSAGNLVVRAILQLPEAFPMLPLLHSFISVAGPHLGLPPMPFWLTAGCK